MNGIADLLGVNMLAWPMFKNKNPIDSNNPFHNRHVLGCRRLPCPLSSKPSGLV